ICARTVIAKGAPTKASTGAAHGAPLGDREVAATRQALGWSYPPFEIPENVYRGWDAREAGKRAERRWNRLFAAYGKQYPAEAAEFTRRMAGQLPGDFDEKVSSLLKEAGEKAEATATRKASQQALEQAASLRLMPNMEVWRPCDGAETAVAWAAALRRKDGPTALLLTRQSVPFVKRNSASDIERGGYVVSDPGQPRAVVIATGSEVHLAVGAQALLAAEGIALRVVSMPSTSVFDRQSEEYRKSVLQPGLPRVAGEAGGTD